MFEQMKSFFSKGKDLENKDTMKDGLDKIDDLVKDKWQDVAKRWEFKDIKEGEETSGKEVADQVIQQVQKLKVTTILEKAMKDPSLLMDTFAKELPKKEPKQQPTYEVDFHGNAQAEQVVGAGNLFSSEVRYVVITDTQGNTRYGRRQAQPRVGYYDGEYIPVFSGYTVRPLNEEEVTAYIDELKKNPERKEQADFYSKKETKDSGRIELEERASHEEFLARMKERDRMIQNGTLSEYSTALPASIEKSVKTFYTYLTEQKGLPKNNALGLIANIQRESGFNPATVGDHGTSFGLFQWHAGRGQRMKESVPNWETNWQGQVDFALFEPGEPGALYAQSSFDTPEEAARWWMVKWERPADPTAGQMKHTQFLKSYPEIA